MACGTLAVLAASRATLFLVTVEGRSMEPCYRNGDHLLVLRRPPSRTRPGQVVVLRGPFGAAAVTDRSLAQALGSARTGHTPSVVKRLAGLPGRPAPANTPQAGTRIPHGRIAVLGDNRAHSSDSREWGLLRADQVIGVVWGRVSRA